MCREKAELAPKLVRQTFDARAAIERAFKSLQDRDHLKKHHDLTDFISVATGKLAAAKKKLDGAKRQTQSPGFVDTPNLRSEMARATTAVNEASDLEAELQRETDFSKRDSASKLYYAATNKAVELVDRVMEAIIESNEAAKIAARIAAADEKLEAATKAIQRLEEQLKAVLTHRGEASTTPMPEIERAHGLVETARATRGKINTHTPGAATDAQVDAFVRSVDDVQAAADRAASMVEAELAAALADTTSALAMSRLQLDGMRTKIHDLGAEDVDVNQKIGEAEAAVVAAEALATRVSSAVPSHELVQRFAQATELARVTTEAASAACRDLVARVKAEQQKNMTLTLEEGVKRMEACAESLAKWKTMHSRFLSEASSSGYSRTYSVVEFSSAEKAIFTARQSIPKLQATTLAKSALPKIDKFLALVTAAEAAVDAAVQGAHGEISAFIADACARIVAHRTYANTLNKRNEEDGSPDDAATADVHAAIRAVEEAEGLASECCNAQGVVLLRKQVVLSHVWHVASVFGAQIFPVTTSDHQLTLRSLRLGWHRLLLPPRLLVTRLVMRSRPANWLTRPRD